MNRNTLFGTVASRIFTMVFVTAFGIAAQNTLVLNVGQAQDTIKKTIYGALMEDWGRDIYGGIYVGSNSSIPNTNGMRNDIIAGLKEIDIGVLQYPGGCKSEVYHWQDGIGAKSSRPGGDMVNGMGTDEYFQLCTLVNCAPFIQVNCREGTPNEMAGWLNYINDKYPNKLRYVGIGNEPWGGCYAGISVAEYLNNWYDRFKVAIPAVFSGKIIRIAAAGYTDESSIELNWTNTVLQREVGSMEGLSWHYYTTMSWTEGQKGSSYQFTETEYYNILTRAYAMETQAKKMIAAMNTADPNFTCGLQPDEWGAWYNQFQGMGTSYQQSTVRDAQITAQHLNFFNNNCRRIWMAQSAQPVNAIHALFLTNTTGGAMIKTPSFYVYKLYVPHHNARMVPATLTCDQVKTLNTLTASASVNAASELHISVSNIHATASQPLTITLNGGSYQGISGQIVNGQAITSYNDYNKAEQVNIANFASSNFSLSGNTVTTTLPAHSVVMFKLVPSNSGIGNQTKQASQRFAVASLPGNRIMVRHVFPLPTPIALSLFSLDGKSAAPVFQTVVPPDNTALVWEPKVRNLGKATYILSMRAPGFTWSRRVVLQEGK
jgi:alpha-N-arabinofuranosidase